MQGNSLQGNMKMLYDVEILEIRSMGVIRWTSQILLVLQCGQGWWYSLFGDEGVVVNTVDVEKLKVARRTLEVKGEWSG